MSDPSRRVDETVLLIYACVSVILWFPAGGVHVAEADPGFLLRPLQPGTSDGGVTGGEFAAFTSLTQSKHARSEDLPSLPQITITSTTSQLVTTSATKATNESQLLIAKHPDTGGTTSVATELIDVDSQLRVIVLSSDQINDQVSLRYIEPNSVLSLSRTTTAAEGQLFPPLRSSSDDGSDVLSYTDNSVTPEIGTAAPPHDRSWNSMTNVQKEAENSPTGFPEVTMPLPDRFLDGGIRVTTSVSTSSSTRIFPRASSSSSSNRKQHRKQAGFQDIITGLVKLLGGKNVHINGESNGDNESADSLAVASSRLNHRAPARVSYAEPNTQQSVVVSSSTFPTTSTSTAILPTTVVAEKSNTATTNRVTATLTSSNVETSRVNLQGSTTSTISATSSTATLEEVGKIPTGPITEWIPAYGGGTPPDQPSSTTAPPPKHSTTTTTSQTKTTSRGDFSTVPLVPYGTITTSLSKFTTTATAEQPTVGKPNRPMNNNQPQTEISYADIAPTKTGAAPNVIKTETTMATSTSSSERDPLPEFIHPQGTSTTDRDQNVPSAGIVLPVPIVRPTRPEVGGSYATGQPAGSPYVIPVDIHQIRLSGEGEADPVLDQHAPAFVHPSDEQVYIDGRKTYFDLRPTETAAGGETTLVNVGFGYSFPNGGGGGSGGGGGGGGGSGHPPVSQGSVSNVRLPQQHHPTPRPQHGPPPQLAPPKNPQVINKTPVRIDTCIIGDESACNVQLNETCRVEAGVSSCNCRLGYGRDGLEQGCKPVVSLVVYIKVDRVNSEAITFGPDYQYSGTEKYQILEFESKNAVDSAFSLSAFAESYAGCAINSFFSMGGRVIINSTVNLLESPQTRSPTIKQELKRSLIAVIQQQNQNIGQSRLYVNGPLNPIPGVQDLDECADPNLNDCSKHATCANTFGSYKCACAEGFIDKYMDEPRRNGRICTVCSPQYCNNRGECVTTNGKKECRCHGNYIGAKCETDGEVLGVALGASLAALVIIVLTLVCLCMWSRRWKRDQQKILGRPSGGGGSNYSYFNKANAQGSDFHLPVEDRIRWPQSNDSLDNFYAQPEPVGSGHVPRLYPSAPRPPLPTSPPPQSSAHKTIQALRSLPLTGSRSNIMDDTDEDEQEHAYDTNSSRFHFPRPKSRISHSGHNNIYYDVTYGNGHEQQQHHQQQYTYDKDYGNINAFPLRNMRPFHN